MVFNALEYFQVKSVWSLIPNLPCREKNICLYDYSKEGLLLNSKRPNSMQKSLEIRKVIKKT